MLDVFERIYRNFKGAGIFLIKEINQSDFAYSCLYKVINRFIDYFLRIDTPYHKSFDLDHDAYFTSDSPYKYFWIDYIKVNRRFYKKFDSNNLQGTIFSDQGHQGRAVNYISFSNELALMIEDYELIKVFISIIVHFLNRPEIIMVYQGNTHLFCCR